MTISAEVVGDGLEVSFSELPGKSYHTSAVTLICDAASMPYRRGESRRWFAAPPRPSLDELNGRPC